MGRSNVGNGLTIVADVLPPGDNPIRGIVFSENGGLGIDLGNDGVTPNDIGDADAGLNQLLKLPRALVRNRGLRLDTGCR